MIVRARYPITGRPAMPRRRGMRGMGQTSITESLLNFLQDTMGQIQAGGNFPIVGPGNDMAQFTVSRVLTWVAQQYCNAHANIEPACANPGPIVAQVAGSYANLPAVPASLANYGGRTGPVTYASGAPTPINWQAYYTPPASTAAETGTPSFGVMVHSDPGIALPASPGLSIPPWFTDPAQSLIPNVPNWGLLAAGAVALFLFSGKR